CLPASGVFHTAVADGPYDDGNACTEGEACLGGLPQAGTPVNTDDSNPCTTDGCLPASGVFHTAVADGPYDDGNACTEGEACLGGLPQAGTPVNTDDSNPCTTDGCLPASGVFHAAVADGPYDDGNACTEGEACLGGLPQAGTPVNTDDSNPCTTDGCLPASGVFHTAVADGPYDDGNACTEGEACLGGLPQAGTPVNTDDSNPCTTDGCLPASGVFHTAVAD